MVSMPGEDLMADNSFAAKFASAMPAAAPAFVAGRAAASNPLLDTLAALGEAFSASEPARRMKSRIPVNASGSPGRPR